MSYFSQFFLLGLLANSILTRLEGVRPMSDFIFPVSIFFLVMILIAAKYSYEKRFWD